MRDTWYEWGRKTAPEDGVHRFTVSSPSRLFERGEADRERLHLNRSEYVAYLYRRYIEELQKERRIARYTDAYRRQPSTPAEDALTPASAELLASEPS